ncbi:MAG: class I SAM-dependent methyltransferase [Acidimicrobiales bacterium]
MDASGWDDRYRSTDLLWGSGPNVWLAAEAEGLPPGRAMDLACGEGRNAIWLAEQGWRSTGVDFSAVALDKGRAMAAERGVSVEWIRADLATYEPPESAFDLVVLAYLHLPREVLASVLGRAITALAPGGSLLVIGHDLANLTEGVGGPQDPSVLYTKDDVTGWMGSLEIAKAERVARPVAGHGPDGGGVALDVLVRGVKPAP